MTEMQLPGWLPAIISLSEFDSDWNRYVEHLYGIFENDFIKNTVLYKGKKVIFDNRIQNGKPACFWHLITGKYDGDPEREWSLVRCERLCWIRPIIENAEKDSLVLVWENTRERKRNTVFFLSDHDYVVILNNRRDFYLVTAYYINYPLRKEQLLKEYKQMQNPPQVNETD